MISRLGVSIITLRPRLETSDFIPFVGMLFFGFFDIIPCILFLFAVASLSSFLSCVVFLLSSINQTSSCARTHIARTTGIDNITIMLKTSCMWTDDCIQLAAGHGIISSPNEVFLLA